MDDINTCEGFARAIGLTLRLQPSASLWGGVPCASYIVRSKSKHCRTIPWPSKGDFSQPDHLPFHAPCRSCSGASDVLGCGKPSAIHAGAHPKCQAPGVHCRPSLGVRALGLGILLWEKLKCIEGFSVWAFLNTRSS